MASPQLLQAPQGDAMSLACDVGKQRRWLHTQPFSTPPSLPSRGFSLQQTQRPRFSPSKLPVPFLCTSCHYVCSSTQDSIKNHHCGLALSFLTAHSPPTYLWSTLHRHLAPSSPRASRWSKSYCPEHQAEASILGLSVASPAPPHDTPAFTPPSLPSSLTEAINIPPVP